MNLVHFQNNVWSYYKKHGREMPWRGARDPYKILVSEIMLQQTQVARVLVKYPQFIKAFPSFRALARAPLSKVLRVWQGMGYNRRAIALKKIAEIVVLEYKGKLPRDSKTLETLPSIGRATAGSICAFAFNSPIPFIETNIRRVFIHFFFSRRNPPAGGISDEMILPLVEKTIDKKNPREWYYSLMDYGAMLAKKGSNPNRKSAHYARQSKFKGSNREIRGKILKLLLNHDSLTAEKMQALLSLERKAIKKNLLTLKKEGFILKTKNKWHCT